MQEPFEIVYEDKPQEAAWGIIGSGLAEYNEAQAGADNASLLCYSVRDGQADIIGGVMCQVYWDWLYIDLMWLPEELRGQGYGAKLLSTAEAEARRRGAKNAYLDTFDFQAPAFYEKYGYQVFGELPGFPDGHTRYFMHKKLV